MIAEEFDIHDCDIPIRDVKTVIADSCCEVGTDKNGDKVTSVLAIDGTYYRIVVCKHNPPHNSRRKFLDEDKSPPDKLPVYLGREHFSAPEHFRTSF
jgi:hypothetical protein